MRKCTSSLRNYIFTSKDFGSTANVTVRVEGGKVLTTFSAVALPPAQLLELAADLKELAEELAKHENG